MRHISARLSESSNLCTDPDKLQLPESLISLHTWLATATTLSHPTCSIMYLYSSVFSFSNDVNDCIYIKNGKRLKRELIFKKHRQFRNNWAIRQVVRILTMAGHFLIVSNHDCLSRVFDRFIRISVEYPSVRNVYNQLRYSEIKVWWKTTVFFCDMSSRTFVMWECLYNKCLLFRRCYTDVFA